MNEGDAVPIGIRPIETLQTEEPKEDRRQALDLKGIASSLYIF
jgi:hypothetical protein